MKALKGAVFDIGSNTIKFMVAEQRGTTLHIIKETAYPSRLARNINLTGILDPEAIKLSLQFFKKCKKELKKYDVDKIIAGGTSALRRAKNAGDLRNPASEILDVPIEVISGKMEGELVFEAISSNPRWLKHSSLVIDIGGGSVELVSGHLGHIHSCDSLPLGCVSVKEQFHLYNPLDEKHLSNARQYLVKQFSNKLKNINIHHIKFLGSGGTMHNLCHLHQKFKNSKTPLLPWDELEAYKLTKIALGRLIQKLGAMKPAELDQLELLPGRADVITTGAIILEAAMEAAAAKDAFCATRGLRYGYWIRKMGMEPFKKVNRDEIER